MASVPSVTLYSISYVQVEMVLIVHVQVLILVILISLFFPVVFILLPEIRQTIWVSHSNSLGCDIVLLMS